MFILPSNLFKRSSNVGGGLKCQVCGSNKLKKVDHFPPDRDVYRCYNKVYDRFTKKWSICGAPLTYVTTPMHVDEPNRMKRKEEHPYAHMDKGRAKQLVNTPFGKFKVSKHKI